MAQRANYLKVVNETKRAVSADLRSMIIDAVRQGSVGALNGLAAYAKALEGHVGNREDLAGAHQKVARRMQTAMLAAYDSNVEARKGVEQRASAKRYKGQLRRRLADPRMVVADADGINYINLSILRQTARHFMRLNFGAGAAAGGQISPSYPLRLFGVTLADVGFHQAPRPGFKLPSGLFFGEGGWTRPSGALRGTGYFVPLRTGFKFDKETRGIEPRYFLEAGIKEMTVALPAQYNALMNSWLHDAAQSGTGPGQTFRDNIKVRGGTAHIKNLDAASLQVRA